MQSRNLTKNLGQNIARTNYIVFLALIGYTFDWGELGEGSSITTSEPRSTTLEFYNI